MPFVAIEFADKVLQSSARVPARSDGYDTNLPLL